MIRILTANIFLTCIFVAAACSEDAIFDSKVEMVLKAGAGEGPAWHPTRGLFFSGDGHIMRWKPGEESKPFRIGAGTNGLLFDAQLNLLACEPKLRRVSRSRGTSGEIEVLAEKYLGKPFNQPNDIAVDSKGRVYFSDPKYGSRDRLEIRDANGREIEGVYRIDRDGTLTMIIAHEVDRPNGLVVSSDDRFLFIADNNNNVVGGARKLWRFDLDQNGTPKLESQKLLMDWKDGRGPDGMVLDQKGQIYVAGGLNKDNRPFESAKVFKGGVYVLSQSGQLLSHVTVPVDEVTNCTFGGDDLKTLFITAGGTLWKIRTKTAGSLIWSK